MKNEESWRAERRKRLWRLFDFSEGRGVEIGPLHAPVIAKDAADVVYVDLFDRERLVERYSDDPLVDTDRIPWVDFPLRGRGGRLSTLEEVLNGSAPYDWVFASHVIEHVPDLVGWLRGLHHVLKEDGVIVLAVPDRRYCFDVHRPQTTIGQVLQAYWAGDRVPSPRAVFDSLRDKVEVDVLALWRGEVPALETARVHTLEQVSDAAERARRGEYVDAHVWTFTPESLAAQLREAVELGLSPWLVDRVVALTGDGEFHAVLRRAAETRYSESSSPWRYLP